MAVLWTATEMENMSYRAWAYAELGTTYMEMQRLDEAIAVLQEAVTLDGSAVDYHLKLAQALLVADREEEALREFELLATLKPDDLSINAHLEKLREKAEQPR